MIPARSGSKAIPRKNLRLLGNVPLVSYTIELARQCSELDRVILSTDSEEIASLGRRGGVEVPFLRPKHLARSDTPMLPVLQHAVTWVESDGFCPWAVVLLQPTAPLRRPEHVSAALKLLAETACDSVVSVVRIPSHYSPQYAMRLVAGRLEPLLPEGRKIYRRQDTEPAFSRDGTVYAVQRDVLMGRNSIYGDDSRPLVLSSEESINLDTLDDWESLEALFARRGSSLNCENVFLGRMNLRPNNNRDRD